MTAINATLEVDFLGQCASESLGSAYWSSSGGQPDFARGAVLSEHGQAFIVLHSTTSDGETSRIVPRLHPGAAVTTFKNVVDRSSPSTASPSSAAARSPSGPSA